MARATYLERSLILGGEGQFDFAQGKLSGLHERRFPVRLYKSSARVPQASRARC
jgi:hypothetical protein